MGFCDLGNLRETGAIDAVTTKGIGELRDFLAYDESARVPAVVATLVAAARTCSNAEEAEDLRTRARLVAGEDWTEGPELVAAAVAAGEALGRSTGDPHARAAVLEAARELERSGFADLAHPHFRPNLHLMLSLAHRDLYRATGDVAELRQAVAQARAAVDTLPEWRSGYEDIVGHFAECLTDLDEARGERGSGSTPASAEGAGLPGLYSELLDRAGSGGQRAATELLQLTSRHDANEQLAERRAALGRAPLDDPTRSDRLDWIAVAYLHHCRWSGRLSEEMQQAADDCRAAVEATPGHHPQRLTRLVRLAQVQLELYESTFAADDLVLAIADARAALDALPDDHPWRAPVYVLLASAQAKLGSDQSLNEQADACARSFADLMGTVRSAVAAMPGDDPARPEHLARVATITADAYTSFGCQSAPERAGEVQQLVRDAFDAPSTGDATRCRWLVPLVEQLAWLVVRDTRPEMREQFHAAVRTTVDALPVGGEHRRTKLATLARALESLHAVLGDRALLEGAIDLAQQAFAGRPEVGEVEILSRDQLLGMIEALYRMTGDRAVLDQALVLTRAAVDQVVVDEFQRTPCRCGSGASWWPATRRPASAAASTKRSRRSSTSQPRCPPTTTSTGPVASPGWPRSSARSTAPPAPRTGSASSGRCDTPGPPCHPQASPTTSGPTGWPSSPAASACCVGPQVTTPSSTRPSPSPARPATTSRSTPATTRSTPVTPPTSTPSPWSCALPTRWHRAGGPSTISTRRCDWGGARSPSSPRPTRLGPGCSAIWPTPSLSGSGPPAIARRSTRR